MSIVSYRHGIDRRGQVVFLHRKGDDAGADTFNADGPEEAHRACVAIEARIDRAIAEREEAPLTETERCDLLNALHLASEATKGETRRGLQDIRSRIRRAKTVVLEPPAQIDYEATRLAVEGGCDTLVMAPALSRAVADMAREPCPEGRTVAEAARELLARADDHRPPPPAGSAAARIEELEAEIEKLEDALGRAPRTG